MCDSIFSFGQQGGHFLQCPSRRDYTRLPGRLHRLLTSNQIALVYHVALGYGDTFLITYRAKSGHDMIQSHDLPAELNDFLYAQDEQQQLIRSITSIQLVLGAYNASFFVQDRSSCLWMNLPKPLLRALQSRIEDNVWIDKPRILALGAEDNFVLVTEKHFALWKLPHYRDLARRLEYAKLQPRGFQDTQKIVLHPYRYSTSVALSYDGTIMDHSLPDWNAAAIAGMRAVIAKDSREAQVKRRQAELAQRPSLRQHRETDGAMGERGASKKKLQECATVKRVWNERDGIVARKASVKGVKLSFSLSVNVAGITSGIGKLLG